MGRMLLHTTLLFVGPLCLATAALADVKGGVDAWARGDYTAAVTQWQGPAAGGDADAQFNLGQAYKLGRGVKQDLVRAEELFGKAAEQGHLQASDNYGLLLFQRGDRARALPFIRAAADRGDPRAQYLLGVAHFNGDGVTKDWVRAYALTSLAQQAGLPQATAALAQMDAHIPLALRQQSVPLASQIAADASATRARQLAAVDLGSQAPGGVTAPPVTAIRPPRPPVSSVPAAGFPSIARTEDAVTASARAAGTDSPRTAGADYVRGPRTSASATAPVTPIRSNSQAAAQAAAAPTVTAAPLPRSATSIARPQTGNGGWRIQLGAFSVPGNANALWDRVKSRPEVTGRAKLMVPAGRVTKLQAGGYDQAGAQAACARLTAAGFTCIVTRN